jgi:hypothetical protein
VSDAGAPALAEALGVVVERVVALRAAYEPPDFAHVPGPDSAIFLCAVDHKSGYERAHMVAGEGPYEGSELMWSVALANAPEELRADRMARVDASRVAEIFRIDDETVADPERRAVLWRDLSAGLGAAYGGEAKALLAASASRLAGPGGLLERLTAFEAYGDPLAKKAQLFAKICERRGWLEVADPESWQVSADNVLMRLALRSGLVDPGDLVRVRAATRAAFKGVAAASGISPPVLDDMLWELGRADPDLLGRIAGDLREPARDPASSWY